MRKDKSFCLILFSLFFHLIVLEVVTFVRGHPPCGDNRRLRILKTQNVVDHWDTEEGIDIIKTNYKNFPFIRKLLLFR